MKGREAIDDGAATAAGALHPSLGHGAGLRPLRLARNLGLALIVLTGLFVGGFGLFGYHIGALVTPKQLDSADAIIVLTGGKARIGAAIDLLKSGKGQRLLISGVNPVADADDLRVATGAEKALFTCCVDIDHAAVNTIGNAEESAKWVRANAFESVILVTSNYHMPRSLLEMSRYVETADLQPYPVVNTPIDKGVWMTRPGVLRLLFKEYTKYLAAFVRGLLPTTTRHADPTSVESTVASRAPMSAR